MSRTRESNLKRVLNLLEAVAQARKPISVKDLNATLGFPTPTIYRLCSMLEEEGFLVRQLDGRRFIPGARFYDASWGVIANMTFSVRRHAILEVLSRDIGETCNLAIPDGTEMVYIDRVESHWLLQIQLPVGSRVPAYCSASGKLYLSLLPNRKRRSLLSIMRLEPLTKATITDPDVLEQELREIRRDEVGRECGEFADEMLSVAVPIKDRQGKLCSTLSVHAPMSRLNAEDALAMVPRLREAAADLAKIMRPEPEELA